MPKKTGKPSQTWMTFLRNHVGQMVSIDFFTVPTLQLRVLYVPLRMTVDVFCISMSRNTRLPRGRHSSSWRHFPATLCLATWCAIVMGSTDTTSPRELMEWVSARFRYRLGVLGRTAMRNG